MTVPPQSPTTVSLLPAHPHEDQLSSRTIARVITIVLTVIFTIVLVRLLWQPIAWILIAMFLAIALSGPVNLLARRMRRGLCDHGRLPDRLLVPVAIASLIVPPLCARASTSSTTCRATRATCSTRSRRTTACARSTTTSKVTDQINKFADDAPGKIGEAAGVLSDVGSAIVSSIFAGFTIFVLSIFMVARGRSWIDAGLDLRGGTSSEAITRALDRIANAVGSYVGGAIAQATVAGLTAFLMLSILGVPFAARSRC